MKHLPIALLLVSSCLVVAQIPAAPVQPQPIALQAIAAFAPMPVRQIQLSGTAKAYAGSLQPAGTFTATLQSTGETKLQLDLGELSRTETTGAFGDTRKCRWASQDGVEHDVAHHNCQTAVNWLVPVLDLHARVSVLTQAIVSREEGGASVQELSLAQSPGDSSPSAALIARLSNARLALDPATFLPSSLSFNVHPDKDAGLDIPIVVRYSDYRQI